MALDITKHKQEQEALIENKERLIALMDHNPSLVFLKDEEGRYVYLNKAYEMNFISSGRWYGKTDFDFWPKESAELFRANDTNVLNSGLAMQFMEDSTDMEGKRYCWLNYKFPFTDSRNRKYVGGIGIDITRLIQAEEALKESEIKYRELVENSPAGIYEIDFRTGKFTSVNDAMCIITGYSREELLDMTQMNLLDKESADRFRQRAKQWLSGEEPEKSVDYKLITKDGRELTTLLNVKFTRDEKGNPLGASVIGYDITERKKAEEMINRQNAVLMSINDVYEASAACATDRELGGECLKIIKRLIGNKAGFIGEVSEGGGLQPIAFDPGEEIMQIPESMAGHRRISGAGTVGLYRSVIEKAQTLLTNDPSGHPDSTGTPAGHFGLSSFLGVPFILEGKVLGLIGAANKEAGFSGEDRELLEAVTPSILEVILRKKAEEELQKSERQALKLVNELKEADRNKNQFISVLSHELRNPLAAISAGVQVLDVTRGIDETEKAKEIINRQMNHLCKLVDDLLEMTRISQNKIKLKKENIDLNEIVKNSAEDLRPEFIKKGIKLETEIQERPVIMSADPVRVIQAIGNLLSNALKFTHPNGAVRLTLKKDKDYAVINVKDNGIGISPETLQNLFTPFTQADSTMDRNGGGLGLGLSIIKGIVDLHEGSVDVNSDGLEKGSEFTIRLPIITGENAAVEKAVNNKADKKALNLLIIDDNRDFTDLLSTMLCAAGYNVNIAYDGTNGLILAKQIKPNVIFCDIGLPGMNGYDVAKYIRSDNELRGIKLVALTGYAVEGDVERALKAGFDKHLAKPATLADLQNVL